VLIGILLPALSMARKQANMVVCASNLHQVGLGLQLYATANKNYFPGPNTSGYGLSLGGTFAGAAESPVQNWDWVSPILGKMMNMVAATPGMTAPQVEQVRLQKYLQIMESSLKCPENDIRYGELYSGTALPMSGFPHIMSYSTASLFHFMPPNSTSPMLEDSGGTAYINLPLDYCPKLTKIGNASQKVFAFEGARYWDPAPMNFFDYSTGTNTPGLAGRPQGNFHSRGPACFQGSGEPYLFDSFTPIVPSVGFVQASLRHRGKMQVCFFDGHVEAMTPLQASRLEYWAPSKSVATNAIGAYTYNQLTGTATYGPGYVLP
jgi:prepilin-type processing-associated H-X9-DG protein